jgi:tellurite resistance protein
MAERVTPRPKMFPPPEFPPRRPARFARMPPAVFSVLLGLVGLGLALRRGLEAAGLNGALADLLLGAASTLWAFAVLGYGVKLARRPGVLLEDMRVLPGRVGLAAATMGGMAVAAALAPVAPVLAKGVLVAALAGHALLAVVLIRVLLASPPEARMVNPGWHLAFVGFIVGGIAAPGLGWESLALVLLWATVPVAVAIWGVSAVHLIRRIPPAPLRPMLAIHLAPASLFATVSGQMGVPWVPLLAVGLGGVILLALLAAARWITESGFSAMWGAFTFPLAAYASALFVTGWDVPGMLVLAAALGVVPVIAYRVITLWGSGRLAAVTNAAEA